MRSSQAKGKAGAQTKAGSILDNAEMAVIEIVRVKMLVPPAGGGKPLANSTEMRNGSSLAASKAGISTSKVLTAQGG